MTSTLSIPVTALRVGMVLMAGPAYQYPTLVESIDTRANDSILPHVLINGMITVALRGTVEVAR